MMKILLKGENLSEVIFKNVNAIKKIQSIGISVGTKTFRL